ncbi:hypothetical protein Btru_036395 [Bulinus truncatus]|nr:hypothetical protein Btru_036395 [Bulinus truncatus]
MNKFFSCCCPKKEDTLDGRKKRKRMVIVGDGACGKTALMIRMTTGNFVDIGYIPTVFETEMMEVNTGKETVELVIFDTAGQEDYDRLRPFSYNDIDVVLICFSLADSDTLLNVMANWAPEIRYYCKNAPVILVGNKKDLRDPECSSSSTNSLTAVSGYQQDGHTAIHGNTDKQRATTTFASSQPSPFNDFSRPVYKVNAPVKHSEGALIASRIGAMAYFETSSITGENVDELLLATTKAAVLGIGKSRKFRPFTETLKSWKSLQAINSKK